MKLFKIILFLLFLNNTNSLYNLIIKKCDGFNEPVIDYLRYQYDYTHYPIYCIKNNEKFNFNNIKYMYYSLLHNWYACDEDFKYLNMSIKDKNLYLWELIWNNYGSCSEYNMYDYFNKTFILFYQNYNYYKKCFENDKYCSNLFDSELNKKNLIIKYYIE